MRAFGTTWGDEETVLNVVPNCLVFLLPTALIELKQQGYLFDILRTTASYVIFVVMCPFPSSLISPNYFETLG